MNQLFSICDYNLRILTLLLMVMFSSTISAQDVDGLVLQPELLARQDVSIQPLKGPPVDGELVAILPSRKVLADVSFFEIESSGRAKKIRADQIGRYGDTADTVTAIGESIHESEGMGNRCGDSANTAEAGAEHLEPVHLESE